MRIAMLEVSLHVSPQTVKTLAANELIQPDCEGADLHWASRRALIPDSLVCGF